MSNSVSAYGAGGPSQHLEQLSGLERAARGASSGRFPALPDGDFAGGGSFGPAFVRGGASARSQVLPSSYGPDALPRGGAGLNGAGAGAGPAAPESAAASEAEAAEARTLKALEQRDSQVRRSEEAKGEAVAGEGYIYQIGPDGQRYAVGTAPHLVRAEGESGAGLPGRADEMSSGEEDQLRRLKERDAKVRAHEAAHVMAAGGQAGSPTYTYQTGPDGRRYAVGGSVNISMLSTGDAEFDERQARRAGRAALAAGDPSPQDLRTAATAAARAMQARMGESL
ncbi:hypothetical protein LJC36_05000 [Desulfovibrio sp. OttesenSCG-928-C14]|nr:hypothetical protein [Desulfovibrio sp. OttesenSCG-928-C14]